MLTITYALVALSVEQKKVRSRLLELQQKTQQQKGRLPADQRRLESLFVQFTQLDEACRDRNIELYLTPALRAATAEGDSLLAEIEALTSMGRIVLKSARERLRQTSAQGAAAVEEFCGALELYCQHLLKRLTVEELHLLPLAQRAISSDEWFDIAAKFISHEADKQDRKMDDHDAEPILKPTRTVAAGLGNIAYQVVN